MRQSKRTRTPTGGWETYIMGLVSYLRGLYAERNKQIMEIRRHRMMEYSVNVPEKCKITASEIVLPLTFDFIRRTVAILADTIPHPKRIPLGDSSEAQVRSSKIESWLTEAYKEMSHQPVYQEIVDSLPADGMTVWKAYLKRHDFFVLRNPDEEPDDYRKRITKHRQSKFPFAWEHIDSTTYYPVGTGEDEVLEISRRECLPLVRQYNLGMGNDGRLTKSRYGVKGNVDWPESVEFIEYWNRDMYCYLADGVLVEKGEHGYGRPPYYIAYASVISDKSPNHRSISFAFPLIAIEQALSDLTTIQMNWNKMHGFPSGKLRPVSDDAIQGFDQLDEVVIKPGDIMQIPLGYDFDWISPPPAGAGMAALEDFLSGLAKEISLAPVLYGITSSNTSNAAVASMVAIAKSIFGPALINLTNQFGQMASWMLEMVDTVFEDDVPVWDSNGKKADWITISPKEIEGHYRVGHEITAVIPAEQYQKTLVLADGNQRGLIPDEVVIEDGYGYPNPEALLDKVFINEITKTNAYKVYLWGKFMEMMGEQGGVPQEGTPAGIPAAPGGPGAPVVSGVGRPLPINAPEGAGTIPQQTTGQLPV